MVTVTIKEVARDAGVSVATVSRVLSGKGGVREATRRRVLEVARELDYVPHGAAQSLITRVTRTVGVILPDAHGEFFSELVRGIDLVSRAAGYHLLVSGFHSDSRDLVAILQATRGRVDGLIVMSPEADIRLLRQSLGEPVPVVLLNCAIESDEHDAIDVDNYGGARAVVEHLAGLGHRRIAMVTGPEHNVDSCERLRGFRDGMAAISGNGAGAEAAELPGDFTEHGGYLAGRHLLELEPRPTAVFAANDMSAVGILCALAEAGVRVPDEMTVVGFDDVPLARYLTPPLTSVAASMAEVGRRAMERLVLAMLDPAAHRPERERLPARLVVRSSCAPPPAPRPEARGVDLSNREGGREGGS
jgi:LacI family transcriptional regulator